MVKRKAKNNNNYNWSRAFRDIVIAAINKGQLPILGIIGIFFVILWRVPPEDLSTILSTVIDHLINGELWAYLLLVLTWGGWFAHAKTMRTNFSLETNRISREKTLLQNQLNNKDFRSSEQ